MLARILKIGFAALVCAVFISVSVYAETVTTNVTVDEDNIVKASEKSMLSMGDTWDAWRMYMGNGVSAETSKRYLDMINEYQIPVGQQRMSGADTSDFFWKDTIGSMEERGDGSPFSRNFGIVEWIKSVMAVNKDASFTFALNIVNDTIENHADLVRFLTLMPDDPNAVGSDGINWAQKRVDSGIPNPVKIKLFELGNEVHNEGYCPISDTHTVTAEEATEGANRYAADCVEIIKAMRAVNPNITFAMSGYSSGNGGAGAARAWNGRVLTLLSDYCGYIVDHKYYYDYNFKNIQDQIKNRYIDLMNEIPEEKRPKLYYSEYGCWVEAVSNPDSMTYLPWATSLKGALTDAKFLNGFLMNSPDVEMAAIFCTSGSQINTSEQWGSGFSCFRIFDDGKIYATAPIEMLKIFNEAVGSGKESENVVKTTLSAPTDENGVREHSFFGGWNNFPVSDSNNPDGGENTPAGILTASAHTTADGGLNLIFVNSNDNVAHNISADFKNKYKLREELILTSEFLSDNNVPETPDIVYSKRNLINSSEEFKTHYIPPKSIVVLKLVGMDYEYRAASNIKISFTGQSGYEDGISAVGPGSFGIAGEVYENRALSGLDKAVIMIPKQGIDASEVINNLSENLQNLCYINQTEVKRNIAYFNVNLGDAPEGRYRAIIGNLESNMYETVDFYYRGLDGGEKLIQNILFKNAVNFDEKEYISNDEYLVKTEVTFNNGFSSGEMCKVTVARGNSQNIADNKIVHTGYIPAECDGKREYSFYMPKDAINGNYTVEIEYLKNGEGKSAKRAEFYFNKPNERLTVSDVLRNQNDEELTRENISGASEIKLNVKNNEDSGDGIGFTAIAAFYDKDKRLRYISCSNKESVSAGESKDTLIRISGIPEAEDTDYIAVYIWSSESTAVPFSNVYYIK